jgi:hypothetical protein
MSTRLYLNKETNLNFCVNCGHDLRALTNPKHCAHCGQKLNQGEGSKDWSHWDEVLGEDISVHAAVGRFLARQAWQPGPCKVGVIIRCDSTIEASLALHDEGLSKTLADWSRESLPLPGNCMMHPDGDLRLWRDAEDRLVSRAAAIAYYVFGVGLSRKWHIAAPLQAANRKAMVTVDENRMDFLLSYAGDMDQEKFQTRLLESMSMLEAKMGGLKTKSVTIPAVGRISSAVLFLVE